ncbi:MAG: prephenate dehydrogenase/arogenate dehydrogenase family protein [candidate division Zixibacteria bacterium]|nr:prephenate dehydrogenase/arogenate dehydrogenase family protein [candidate division Zixibacteria bacterium]
MKPFRQVAIVGTGLVGGSIGLALRNKKIARVGLDRPEVLRKALKFGAIDRKAGNLKEAVDGADLIILATPVGEILDLLPQLAARVPPAALITDVGSTKREICRLAEKDLKNFIGGHPLAGKEKNGIESADGKLFAGKNWFLCANGNPAALARLKNFVRLLGARPMVVRPEAHDRILAATSHLPQLVSTILAATVVGLLKKETKSIQAFAGTGLRDTTRLAGSRFSVWKDVFATNHLEIERAWNRFAERVTQISDVVSHSRILERRFGEANAFRRRLE